MCERMLAPLWSDSTSTKGQSAVLPESTYHTVALMPDKLGPVALCSSATVKHKQIAYKPTHAMSGEINTPSFSKLCHYLLLFLCHLIYLSIEMAAAHQTSLRISRITVDHRRRRASRSPDGLHPIPMARTRPGHHLYPLSLKNKCLCRRGKCPLHPYPYSAAHPWGTPQLCTGAPSSASLSSSSSTLVDSPRKENGNANDAVDSELRTHLQTCLDENKLANRSLTMDNTASHCAALKGFQHHSTVQFGSSFQQLLTHATMLDFAIEDSNHGGLSQILHGLDRGVDDFLESLERLPFDLRNTQSFISGTSDILQAKSALLAVARQLTSQTDGNASHQTVKRCQQERDILLRAIRVFFEIADLESRLQDKLTVKLNRGPETSPKRRFRFRLPRRQSTGAQRAKLPDTPTVSNPGHYELGDDAANVDEDEYSFHVAMVSDILSPPNLDEYWGVSMPGPVRDAADIVLSDEGDFIQGASLVALVYILTDPQPINIPIRTMNCWTLSCSASVQFCDPVDLAKALISRLEEQPLNLNSSQREAWPLYRSSVRSLVWKFIKTWIDEYWMHEKDRIAGLHIKDFASQSPEQIEPDEKDKIVRILDERREVAISLAPIGDTADKSQSEPMVTSERRIACRQKPIRYKRGLQERADKLVRRVPQYTPSDDDFRSARALDDLIRAADGGFTHSSPELA
ncbi:hypothetical protein F5148DRAFT_315054 [Russula earlei]|uniref:Uncharacterized protein n=1 Tax=Russula earlei TaxID=71964 RepID=A0ACC0U273_9AGAM|nr:hypothetical protein F5148DRAFT_315054 [Russula earlei]